VKVLPAEFDLLCKVMRGVGGGLKAVRVTYGHVDVGALGMALGFTPRLQVLRWGCTGCVWVCRKWGAWCMLCVCVLCGAWCGVCCLCDGRGVMVCVMCVCVVHGVGFVCGVLSVWWEGVCGLWCRWGCSHPVLSSLAVFVCLRVRVWVGGGVACVARACMVCGTLWCGLCVCVLRVWGVGRGACGCGCGCAVLYALSGCMVCLRSLPCVGAACPLTSSGLCPSQACGPHIWWRGCGRLGAHAAQRALSDHPRVGSARMRPCTPACTPACRHSTPDAIPTLFLSPTPPLPPCPLQRVFHALTRVPSPQPWRHVMQWRRCL
jgi:hypothetical protein